LSLQMHKKTFAFILIFIVIFSATPVSAQTSTPPPGPVYIVQTGDTLWDISIRFNVPVADIMTANNMSNQDIFPGDQLVIPGLEGLSGTLVTQPVPLGANLRSLGRQYRVDPQLLIKLNHIVSPDQIYAGYNLIMLEQSDQPALTTQTTLGNDDTLLEMAVRQNTNPWTIAQVNNLSGPAAGLPGDVLFLVNGTSSTPTGAFPAPILSAVMDPLPIAQGSTVQVKINLSQEATLSGLLADLPLHFFPAEDGSQVALQGVSAIADPGLYPLRIDASLADGSRRSFEQMVLITSGNFLTETINGVDPSTIDPAVTGPEDAWLLSLVTPVTSEKYWQGIFQRPVDSNQYCVRSKYGNRRTYNNGALHSFHSGIDFGICSEAHPFDIYAPADGVVVYTGLKTVRGNVTIIDHGEGVYSGLYHQAEIYVSVGDHVTAGQLIGKIGDTGRVTGPHVHWDLWVNGIQVNPTEWLNEIFSH
jgi:murein DD-endopeptidase MepM/ murein hydrolase activator NlpD